jgi:hypothetical protein
MLTLGSGSKLTFIEVLTIKNYKIVFLTNIQILTFINISNYEESLWENTIHKIANPIKILFNIKFTNHGWSIYESMVLWWDSSACTTCKYFSICTNKPTYLDTSHERDSMYLLMVPKVDCKPHKIIHIMVVFRSLTFIESNLQRREYHFVNS